MNGDLVEDLAGNLNIPSEKFTITFDPDAGVTGISDDPNEANVIYYPNPTSHLLNIEFPQKMKVTDNAILHIFDLNGREIYKTNLSKEKTVLDLGTLNEGLYITRLVTKKIVSQHIIKIEN